MKPKIGLMTISLPPELSTVPKEAVQVADDYAKRMEKNLIDLGSEVIKVDEQVQDDKASLEKTRYLTGRDVDLIVYMVGSWVYGDYKDELIEFCKLSNIKNINS